MSARVRPGPGPDGTATEVSALVEALRQEGEASQNAGSSPAPDSSQGTGKAEDAQPDEGAQSPQEGSEASDEAEDIPVDPRQEAQIIDKAPCDKLDDLTEVEAQASEELVRIVEGLIFASPHPLHVREAARILEEDYELQEVQGAFKVLSLGRPSTGLQLARSAQGYRWITDPAHASYVQKLVMAKPQRLSRPQLETLAVVAYRQPVTRPEIDHIRGVDSQATLKALVDRELIAVVGQTADPGRPRLYGTTLFFLEYLSITELDSLPPLGELSELSDRTRELLRSKVGVDEAERLSAQVLALAKEQDQAAASDSELADEEGGEAASSEQGPEATKEGEATEQDGAGSEEEASEAGEVSEKIEAASPDAQSERTPEDAEPEAAVFSDLEAREDGELEVAEDSDSELSPVSASEGENTAEELEVDKVDEALDDAEAKPASDEDEAVEVEEELAAEPEAASDGGEGHAQSGEADEQDELDEDSHP